MIENTIRQLERLKKDYDDLLKKELEKYAEVSYQQGFTNGLHSVLTGISKLVGKNVEPPITVDDIYHLIKGWLSNSEKELEETKKKHNWEE